MAHWNKWRFNQYKCTEAKHLVNPICSAESADYTVGCSSKAYLYHRAIVGISSCGVTSLLICEENLSVNEDKEVDCSFAAEKKYFVYAKTVEKILPEDKFKHFQENLTFFLNIWPKNACSR